MKNKGITLIALVITIIILIILAGIAINLTIGDNGILNKTKYASEEYKNATEKEKQELANVEDYIVGNRQDMNSAEVINLTIEEMFSSYSSYVKGTNPISIQKNGKLIIYTIFTGNGTSGDLVPARQWVTIGVLKPEYAPISTVSQWGAGGSMEHISCMKILPDGTMQVYHTSTSAGQCATTFVYNVN